MGRTKNRVVPGDQDEWLSPTEAATLLNLSRRTLERRRFAKEWPPFIRLSRQTVRYSRRILLAGPTEEAQFVPAEIV